jgi:hypothetical protein
VHIRAVHPHGGDTALAFDFEGLVHVNISMWVIQK